VHKATTETDERT